VEAVENVLNAIAPALPARGFGCQDQDDPPRITGGYKLPPSSLLTRPDEQHGCQRRGAEGAGGHSHGKMR